MNDAAEKTLIRRCPRLGGSVSFYYCRHNGATEPPCHKIFDCWWELFDVVAYLRDTLPERQFNRIVQAAPQAKMSQLVGLAETAKSR